MRTSTPRQRRDILCEICGKHGHASYLKTATICDPCYCRAPSTQCVRCGQMKRIVSKTTGLCPHCMSQPEGTCAHCKRRRIIYNQAACLCHSCDLLLRRARRNQEHRQVQVTCSMCGKVCSSFLIGRAICRSCFRREHNGCATCAQCHKVKVIYVKGEHLCRACYADRPAPAQLRTYIEAFTAPTPFTARLFQLLVTTIDWSRVTRRICLRFQTFGAFLQTHPMPEPLTWQTIDGLCAWLGPAHQERVKAIRGCLHDVGCLLAANGQMESRETYIARRNALGPLKYIPEALHGLIEQYTESLWERRLQPATVRDQLAALASFWTWCEQRAIRSPKQVSGDLITAYLLSLYWKWTCSHCQGTMPFDPADRRAPRRCAHCEAIGTLIQTSWCAQATVSTHAVALRGFFTWAKLQHLVLANPVQRRVPQPQRTIRHYPPSITQRLCSLSAPETDPTEGLILYLIIVHACSLWELKHAQMPVLLPLNETITVPSLATSYYVVLPKADPSRGRHTPGRPSGRLDFPLEAVPWLGPLLERFEQQRRQIVKGANTPYLLVAPGKAHRQMPVSDDFVRLLVQRASLHILGAACTARLLRQTAAVILADTISAGVLPWLGWEEKQAFAYTWVPREVVLPQTTDPTPTAGSVPFPSAQKRRQRQE